MKDGLYTETRVIQRTLTALKRGVKYIIHQGGTSSGKTYGNVYSLLSYLLYERGNEKLLCTMVAEDVPQLRRGVIRDFQDIANKTGLTQKIKWNKVEKTAILPNGTTIEFLAVDTEQKGKGSKRDILFINECNNIKYRIFWQLAIRTTESIILDYNPSGEFWLHEILMPSLDSSDYLFTLTTYKDNPALSKQFIKEIESISDEYLARVYRDGKTGVLTGLIFPNVEYISEFPKDCKKIGYGQDFGFTNDPTTLIKGGVKSDVLFLECLLYQTGLTNPDISNEFKDIGLTKRDEVFADSSEPKSIEEIRRFGWNIKGAVKGSDSVKYGIDLLKSYSKICIVHNVDFRKEQRNYKWKEKNGKSLNIPVDKFNHCWDAARYYAVMKLGNKPKRKRMKAGVGTH